MMPRRKLGTRTVSALALGCMGMTDFYGTPDLAAATETLHLAVARGITLFDTADVYGPYTGEELLGRVLGRRSGSLTLATKCGVVRGSDGSWLGVNGRPDYIKRSCDASLRRMGLDRLGLFYLHRVDPTVPIEDSVGAMAELVAAGKVDQVGLSEASAATLRRAHAVHPVAALQTEYSLWSREVEALFPVLAELGTCLVAYAPLGRGLLAGRAKSRDELAEGDQRRQHPRFAPDNFRHNADRVRELARLAESVGATPAQLALRWVLAQGEPVVALFGTKRPGYLAENLGCLDVEMDDALRDRVERAIGSGRGQRYPEQKIRELDR